jgi:hypothetical protein
VIRTAGEAAGRTGAHSVPLRYLIARLENNRLKVLTLTAGSCGEVLPIFGTGRAAHDFLRRGGFGGGWRVRESTAGELISLLLGHLAKVQEVVLDPCPEIALSDARPEGPSKSDFIATLMGEPLLISAR